MYSILDTKKEKRYDRGMTKKVKVKSAKTGKEYEYSYTYSYSSTLVCDPFSSSEKELINLAYHNRKLKAVMNGENISKKKFIHDMVMESVARINGEGSDSI